MSLILIIKEICNISQAELIIRKQWFMLIYPAVITKTTWRESDMPSGKVPRFECNLTNPRAAYPYPSDVYWSMSLSIGGVSTADVVPSWSPWYSQHQGWYKGAGPQILWPSPWPWPWPGFLISAPCLCPRPSLQIHQVKSSLLGDWALSIEGRRSKGWSLNTEPSHKVRGAEQTAEGWYHGRYLSVLRFLEESKQCPNINAYT